MHDVIVVGGGAVGAATAYLCAREGLRTLLLDRVDAGRATDAGAGILSADTSSREHPTWLAFARLAVAYYPMLLKHLEDDAGGETGYAACDHEITPQRAREMSPPLGPMFRVLFHRNAARVDGRLLNQALVRAAER